MKKLIVNADDFGRHHAINQAVKQGAKLGILTSASLMPGEKAFEEAVEIARELPDLEIGVHLTLVDGVPVSDPAKIPSLVNKQGCFYANHKEFIKRFFMGRVNLQDVALELRAQIEKVAGKKLHLSHVDAHQHLHVLPGILPIVIDLAKQAGIKGIRIPKVDVNVATKKSQGGLGEAVGRMGLRILAAVAEHRAKKGGLVMPNHFAGLVAGTAVDEEYLLKLLAVLPNGITEIMLHPGLDNGVLKKVCGWEHDFEAEYRAIVSPRVVKAMGELGVEIVRREICFIS